MDSARSSDDSARPKQLSLLGLHPGDVDFRAAVGATSTATITMPDYFGNPQTQTLNNGFGNITQVSQRVQANGVLQQSCLIRA